MKDVWLAGAIRTPVATRHGALSNLQAWMLASPLIRHIVKEKDLSHTQINHVLLGNALYGGGNPARIAALDAGLSDTTPAITLDSQCCGGMDAIVLGAQMIRSGAASIVIAGGLESWSRAPQRLSNPIKGEAKAYNRPPFTPWPERDPDMLSAAADLAQQRSITREQQQYYAIKSHAKSRKACNHEGIFPVEGLSRDEYTRELTGKLCQRLPSVAGTEPHTLSAATVASEADAAAIVLLVSNEMRYKLKGSTPAIRLLASRSGGADPTQPAIAPIGVARDLIRHHDLQVNQLHSVHLMEAFAVQAIAFIQELTIDSELCNPNGGALSRGHPIGASGAIEIVDAFHTLNKADSGSISLCAIAAAGGLGSAMLLEKA